MARRAFLGIDCGTQSTKALLVDADTLVPLALGRAPHDLIARDDGTREQHPDWWIAALQTATRQAFEGIEPGAFEVAGIGVSGQQHGMVCLDRADRPIRPAKLWNDTTTGPDCSWLTRKLGGLDEVLRLIGYAYLPGYTAPKISWFHRSEGEAYAKTARICLPHDYLNLWLTGEFATEPGDASGTGYVDVRDRTYQPEVLTLLDGDRECFAGRTIIPELVDGQATWLTGRRLTDREPRYLNLRFPKPLLGLASAKGEAVVVTEGPFDWLTAVEWGFWAVALLGTRVPGKVAQSLERFEDVYLVLDPDEAGREATEELHERLADRAVPVALPPGVSDLNGLGLRPDGRSIFARCILQAGHEARAARQRAA